MPFTGSAPNKTYVRSDGVRTGAAVNVTAKGAAVNNTAALADARENDIATALTTSWQTNGDNQPVANLPMNAHKFTGMAQGSARTDSLRIDQVQDGDFLYAAVDGTPNAIELTLTPASAGPVEGMTVVFIPTDDSTSTVTVDLDGSGTAAAQYNAAALIGGEFQAGLPARITFDGTAWQLENPYPGFAPQDAELKALAGLTSAADKLPYFTGSGTATLADFTSAGRALVDDADAAAQRTTLGLGTIATQAANNVSITGGAISGITDLAVADGGTGASTAAGARTNLGAVLTDAVFPGALVAIIEDQKTQNTAGGTFTSGADRTRVLNTLVYNRNTTVTLSSNQFTLPAGSWDIEWEAPASEVDGHQSWLFDVTGTAVVGRGGSSFGGASATGDTMLSRGNARVAPSGSNTYEIRHRCTTTTSTTGFGRAANFGTEVYTRVIIRAA